MKRLFISILFFVFLFIPPLSSAQENWIINSFISKVTINQDGTVTIREEILVDFQDLDKHGIYRDVPYVYKKNNGENRYTSLEVIQVLRNDRKEKYEVIQNNANIRIRIGDPDKTISHQQKYTLTYIATGILDTYPEFDELYWNITGDEWEVPIDKTTAEVILSQGQILSHACYRGVRGSTDTCSEDIKSNTQALFTTDTLQPGEGMTVALSFPKGTFPILQVERPKTFGEKLMNPHIWYIGGLISFLGIGGIFLTWYKSGRDYWNNNLPLLDRDTSGKIKPIGVNENIVVEFGSPDKLTPAEIGVIMDERTDTLDITATLVDLARRGYLRITEIPKKWLFGSKDYELLKSKKDVSSLLPFERELIIRLFSGTDKVILSTIKQTFYDDLKIIKNMVYTEIVRKELFLDNPESVRNNYLITAVIIIVIGGLCIFFPGLTLENEYFFAIGVGISLIGIALLLFAPNMPRRTAKGRDLYRRARGFKLFLSGAEKYRQQFYEKKDIFSELLPYAIVFGVTEKYAKAMKEMGQIPSHSTWFYGSSLHSSTFATSMNTFSATMSSAMASAPSSSGSSGGGSAGGGGGGGGGGSW